ncbi:MAG TPA: hypothetical protein VIV66_09725 [Pyrinomonadaceae bacterium]
MSAGEFFDLVRPAFLFLSALVSTWVLVNAQRSGQRIIRSSFWAVGTLILPFVVFPLYLAYKVLVPRSTSGSPAHTPTLTTILAALYLITILALIFVLEYRESNSVDRHLAQATQAKLAGNRKGAISEYRAALQLEDDAHTRKLLGIELSGEGEWAEALSEFRLAEREGEPDESLPFRIARLLDVLNQTAQATMEYKRFLYSAACIQPQPDPLCEAARLRVERGELP